jgi:hydroxymethylpyrimidine pyrophosphatase-like HAD family hydrolase
VRYYALACDYDGTIAEDGTVAGPTRAALVRLRASGRRILLVTGRRLDDLAAVCPDLSAFDAIVGENGALVVRPPASEPRLLVAAPPPALFERLQRLGVEPLDRGAVILATTRPHEVEVMTSIRALGLELQVIFNRDAVMVLPSGVNKASGLDAALSEFSLSAHETIGIGDGENDHAFLAHCELAVAVADAVPSLKEAADVITLGGAGAGVVEIVESILASDAPGGTTLLPRPGRREVAVAARTDGGTLAVPTWGGAILCAGTSDGSRHDIVRGILRRLREQGYQYCVIDSHGDCEPGLGATSEAAVQLGTPQRAPTIEEVMTAIAAPTRDVVVNLQSLPVGARSGVGVALLSGLRDLRRRFGRPHWIVSDEVFGDGSSGETERVLLVTAEPGRFSSDILRAITLVLAVGRDPVQTLRETADAMGAAPPNGGPLDPRPGEALAWAPRGGQAPVRVKALPHVLATSKVHHQN